MSAEIQLAHGTTGRTLYALIRNTNGLVWEVVSFVGYVTADLPNYVVPMAEQGTASGYYVGNMPAVPAGVYNVEVRHRAGGAPAETDDVVGVGQLSWDGAAVSAGTSAAAVWAYLGEGAHTALGLLRLAAAFACGKSSGGRTTTVRFRDLADTKDRIVATVTSDGNRTAVTRDST